MRKNQDRETTGEQPPRQEHNRERVVSWSWVEIGDRVADVACRLLAGALDLLAYVKL